MTSSNRLRRPSDMPKLQPIVVVEEEAGWTTHADRLRREKHRLTRPSGGDPEAIERGKRIDECFQKHDVDPLLTAIVRQLGIRWKPPKAGVNPSQAGSAPAEELSEDELRVAVVHHLVRSRGFKDGSAPEFAAAVNAANHEYECDKVHYKTVARMLVATTGDRRLGIADAHPVVGRLVAPTKKK